MPYLVYEFAFLPVRKIFTLITLSNAEQQKNKNKTKRHDCDFVIDKAIFDNNIVNI